MVEDVARVTAGLNLLEPLVIVLVVQRVPGNPGGIPLWIGEVHIGVIDEGTVALTRQARARHLCQKEVLVELANPG